jgi:penicillin-insensitive murein endopeptidase
MRLILLLSLMSAPAPAQEPAFGDVSAILRLAREGSKGVPAVKSPRRKLKRQAGNPWSAVTAPAKGPARSYGTHSKGCLRGGEELPLSGDGYEAMRPSRRRHFGHPRLVSYLKTLGREAAAAGLGELLVGDLGQPRGGPTLTGHASHQSGLDVDVWFRMLPAGAVPSDEEREKLWGWSMVVPDFERLNDKWDPAVLEMLRLAAGPAEVERIFVNPVIKKTACEKHPGAAWLRKLRPWWGHDDHLHARLSCAPGDSGCATAGDDLPAGDGCGAELDFWFTPERKAEARRMRTEPSKPRTLPALPRECAAVLAD